MRNRPHTTELLDAARQEIEARLLPGLGGAQAYQARMVMNALGIVARQLGTGDVSPGEKYLLAQLTGEDIDDTEASFRGLCRRIREGEFDHGPDRERLFTLLWDVTLEQARECSPNYLRTLGLS